MALGVVGGREHHYQNILYENNLYSVKGKIINNEKNTFGTFAMKLMNSKIESVLVLIQVQLL